MYDDADPLLARLRGLAAAFPESSEVESWGRPTFRAGRKIFAVYGSHVDPAGLIVTPDPEERPALLGFRRFSVRPYFGPSGWLSLDLAAAAPDWQEVRELLESSYRQVALVRMVRALDAIAADAGTTTAPGGLDDGPDRRA